MIAMLMLAINHDDIDGNDENVFVKWDQSLFADRALIISTNFEFILVYIYQTIRGGVKNLFTESVHKRGEDFLQLNLFFWRDGGDVLKIMLMAMMMMILLFLLGRECLRDKESTGSRQREHNALAGNVGQK